MDVREGFSDYAMKHPERRREIKRISIALYRAGINTIEQLSEMYRLIPYQLLTIRDIGPGRMDLIGEILRSCGAGSETESR